MSLRVLAAAAAYFLIVFAAGFLLGTLRTWVVAPRLGEICAVIAEIPLMLAIAWLACGWVLGKIHVRSANLDRIAVGAIALGLLLLAETLVSVALGGATLQEHLRSYAHAAPLIGLAAQLLYACFPLIRTAAARERSSA